VRPRPKRAGCVKVPPIGGVRRLALSRLVSWAGTQAAYIALIALIYDRSNGSGVWISAGLLSALGARVLVSPWAGSLGDYFDRRVVMIASDLCAAACFVAISQVHSLVLLVVLAALCSVAEAPFGSASSALLTMLVPEERRGWASGAVSAGMSTGMLIGAASGGLLVASFGAPTAFLVNAASFVGSAILVRSIPGRFRVDLPAASEHRGVLKGVGLMVGNRVLRTAGLSIALVALALGMANVAELPLFVGMGAGKVGFGIGIAAWAVGSIGGGRLASRVVGWHFERLALIAGCSILAVVVGLSGALPVFAVVALLFVAGGLGNTIASVSLVLMIQRWAPPELQSRALAALEAVGNTALGISLVIGGLLLSPLGARGVFMLAGALGAVAVVLAFRIPRDPQPIRPEPERVANGESSPRDAHRLTAPALPAGT
jgi:MFS family permease